MFKEETLCSHAVKVTAIKGILNEVHCFNTYMLQYKMLECIPETLTFPMIAYIFLRSCVFDSGSASSSPWVWRLHVRGGRVRLEQCRIS